ncbi:MAG TPA: hypothetical protein VFC74_02005 [Oscillospiraceae bacterium]|nr:hypothetical protein [Oscillospiraceae bacterium]
MSSWRWQALFILLVLGLLAIALFETPRLILNKMWRELLVFLVLWLLASTLAIMQFYGIKIPAPRELLQKLLAVLKLKT